MRRSPSGAAWLAIGALSLALAMWLEVIWDLYL